MISVGMSVVPDELDPARAWNVQQFLLNQAVYETLVRVSESGNLVGDLAIRWEIDASGRVYTFHLNPKARFHDGRPVTAEDAAWSLSRHFWPRTPSIVRSYLVQVLDIAGPLPEGRIPPCFKTLGPHALRLTLAQPYPPILHVLAMPAFGILPRGAAGLGAPVGSGPMTASYEAAARTWTLRSFPDYSGLRPKIRELTVRPVQGMKAALEAIEQGKVDVVWGLPLGEIDAASLPGRFQVKRVDSLTFLHLFLNAERPVFSEEALRRDLGALLQERFRTEPLTPFHQFQPHYLPRGILPRAYYDRRVPQMTPQAFARKWPKLQGVPLVIALRKDWFAKGMVSALEDSLGRAGLRPQVRLFDAEGYIQALGGSDYDVISGAYMGNFPDPDGFLDPLRKDSKARMGRIPSDELLDRLSKVRSVKDPGRRLGAYARALKDFEARMFLIPLFRMSLPIVADSRISIPDATYRYESELWKLFWER